MTKVRIDNEDVFIVKICHIEFRYLVPNQSPIWVVPRYPIPDKYPFYYNPKWVSNQRNTKQIAIRKIKVFPMPFAFGASITYNNIGMPGNLFNYPIIYSFNDKQNIFDL
jgi:hypothetical protein